MAATLKRIVRGLQQDNADLSHILLQAATGRFETTTTIEIELVSSTDTHRWTNDGTDAVTVLADDRFAVFRLKLDVTVPFADQTQEYVTPTGGTQRLLTPTTVTVTIDGVNAATDVVDLYPD